MTESVITVIVVFFFIVIVAWATVEVVQQVEREFACIGLGYEGYNEDLDACYSGENPMVSRPYETVFE